MKKASTHFYLILSLVALLFFAPRTSTSEEQPPADFTVRQADGVGTFKLSEARGKYVALHFLLKTACPYCIRHTHTYSSRASEVPDAIQIFLKPDTEEEIRAWSVRLNGKFVEQDSTFQLPVIYQDPDANLAKQFGIPFGYEFHGQTVHYPALILLGPDGKEVFRYVGKNNSDRYSFDDFVAKITELKSPIE
ncbi:MAG: redoxin domain-containing protein [bacterium]|nr:redoxin domain-containing protein [bacterium]